MSAQDLTIRPKSLSQVSNIWPKLFEQAKYKSPFLSYEWFMAISIHLLKEDPQVLLFINKQDLVAILPAMIEDNTLKLIGDRRITDYNDIIYLEGYEERIIQSLATFISAENLKIDIFPLQAPSPLVQLLPKYIDVTVEDDEACPLLILPESWEGYLKILTGKQRHELKRKLKKAAAVTTESLTPKRIDILFKLMQSSDIKKKSFMEDNICNFFKEIAYSFFKRRWLRFKVGLLDSEPISSIFSFQFRDRIYLYNMGFATRHHKYAPGIVMIASDIRSAIDEGFSYYDFLRGDERYKLRLGGKIRYTKRIKG